MQNSLISEDDLLKAFREWTKDKSGSIEQILRDQKAMTETQCERLEGLLQEHLERHGSAEKSLAALTPIAPAIASLRNVADHDLNVSLGHIGSARIDPYATRPPTADELTATPAARFRRLRPHAKGGLGEVSVAHDNELNREVALKEIQDHHADRLDSRTRFLVEAEITGGLEHPGIVPVYSLGADQTGRPYYAMRFIEGETLSKSIRRFHDDFATANPGARLEAFQKLLRKFLAVCDAVSYAHSRSVLHRDLKPDNIMVGDFGETLVVDWGLAKAAGQAEPPSLDGSRPLIPASGSGSVETMQGHALGTPAFMSPEQAVGAIDQLGPTTDVYSLGATLYALLTGKPPFAITDDERGENDVGPVLARVHRGEFPPPRVVDPLVPRPLEAICLKAMALSPSDRYPTPHALAEDLEHWLADEPISAHREGWTGHLRRWARRNKAWTQAGAAAVILVAVVSTVAAFLINDSRQKVADALSSESQALLKEKAALAQETQARTEAEANFQMARAAVDDYLTKVSQNTLLKLQDRADLRALRKDLLESALKYYEMFLKTHANDPKLRAQAAAAYARVAEITREIGSETEALRAFEQMRTIYETLTAEAPEDPKNQSRLAISHNYVGDLLSATGRPAEALKSYERARTIRAKLAAEYPSVTEYRNDLAATHNNLGGVLSAVGRPTDAMKAYKQAMGISETLAAEFPANFAYRSDLATNHNNIGRLLFATGQPTEALKAYKQALGLRASLVLENRTGAEIRAQLALSHADVGVVLAATGKPAEAMKAYEQALMIRAKIVADNPTVTAFRADLAISHSQIANLLAALGKRTAALKSYDQALAIREKLAADHPSVPNFRSDLAGCLGNIGTLLKAAGKPAEALKVYERAQAIVAKLAADNPLVTAFRANLEKSYINIGLLLAETGKSAEALKAYQQAIAIQSKLVAENTSVPEFRADLALSHSNVGILMATTGKPVEALKAYEQAMAIRKQLVEENPSVSEFQDGLATCHLGIGRVEQDAGRKEEALKSFAIAEVIFARLLKEYPSNPRYQTLLKVIPELRNDMNKVKPAMQVQPSAADVKIPSPPKPVPDRPTGPGA